MFNEENGSKTKSGPPPTSDPKKSEEPAEAHPDQNLSTEEDAVSDVPVIEYDPDAPEELPDPPPEPKGKKKAKPTKEIVDPHKISKKEVMERLFEKNEIIMRLNKEVEDLEKQRNELHDKWLRTAADFENYRKRTRKEWELLKQQTKAEVVLEILNVVDNFERAFSAVGERDDDFVQGIRLIYNNMLSTLEKMGVKKIEALNVPFDPTYHMAIAQRESEDAKKNDVVEVAQDGYLLDDIVIRPSRVVVAK